MPSRYDNSKVYYDVVTKNNVRPIRKNVGYDMSQTIEIILESGDSLESLAYRLYGSSTLWWILADLNHLEHPLFIKAGTRIRILKPEFIELFFRGLR